MTYLQEFILHVIFSLSILLYINLILGWEWELLSKFTSHSLFIILLFLIKINLKILQKMVSSYQASFTRIILPAIVFKKISFSGI